MTPVPCQSLKINITVFSRENFEIYNFTDHQKHILHIFEFVHPVPLTGIFFSNLKSESRDQMNAGKVQSVQINSVVFMLEF